MIAVYRDSQILELEWIPNLRFPDSVEYHSNFEEYRNSTAQHKVAFTTHRLHCEHDAYLTFEDKINSLSSVSNLVFTFESELHHYHWQMWERCHHDNVYWCVPGQINDHKMDHHIIFWGDWFKTTSAIYKQLPQKLEEIHPFATKPRMFDALLGSPKPHRDFVYGAVYEHSLQDQFIMPYGGAWNDNEFYAKDYFIWEPGTEVVGEQQPGTAGPCWYHGVWTGLSRIIPISVYNDTAYSIVAETDHDNTLSFYTEKTAKVFIARRLFVAFSGYKFLENLRRQGFQTFNGIIDETYDQIPDDQERYSRAFEQVRLLCARDQQEVYEKIRPIVEHNFQHVMQTDWNQAAYSRIQSLLDTKLAQAS